MGSVQLRELHSGAETQSGNGLRVLVQFQPGTHQLDVELLAFFGRARGDTRFVKGEIALAGSHETFNNVVHDGRFWGASAAG